MSHWTCGCHPGHTAPCEMPALEPGALPGLCLFSGDFWGLPSQFLLCLLWLPSRSGHHQGCRHGGEMPGAGVLALPRPPDSPLSSYYTGVSFSFLKGCTW